MKTTEQLREALRRARASLTRGARAINQNCGTFGQKYVNAGERAEKDMRAAVAHITRTLEGTTTLRQKDMPKCEECGNPFVPRRSDQVTCSEYACQRQRKTRKERERRGRL